MPELSFLKLLEKVELRWRTYGGEYVAVPGQVQEIGSDLLILWYNRNAPSYQPPEAAQVLEVITTSTNGVGILRLGVRRRVPVDLMEIDITGEVVWTQRRQYVREAVSLPVSPAKLLSSDEDPLPAVPLRYRDLSAGGLSAWCPRKLAARDRLEISLDLADGEPLVAELTLVDCAEQPEPLIVRGEPFRFIVRGAFPSLPERDRRRVMQYVFKLQVAKRRLAP